MKVLRSARKRSTTRRPVRTSSASVDADAPPARSRSPAGRAFQRGAPPSQRAPRRGWGGQGGAEEVVRALLDANADTNVRNWNRRTPLSMLDVCVDTRIEASPEVIVKEPDDDVQEIMRAHSRNATLVFLGLRVPEKGEEDAYAERIEELLGGVGRSLGVFRRSRVAVSGAHTTSK